MPNFMLLYRGPAMDMSSVTPEQSKAVMDMWMAWFGKVGGAIKDGGNPFAPGTNVTAKGGGKTSDVNGYSIVEAADLNAAKAMLAGHPHFMDARNSIDVMEIVPMGP